MKLTVTDKKILSTYSDFLDGLAEYFGTGYEFVLHSLDDSDNAAIIKIINGFHSGRKGGEPLSPYALEAIREFEQNPEDKQFRTYFTHSKTGVLLKSLSLPVRNEKKSIIGLICINFYTDTPIGDLISLFLPVADETEEYKETFGYNVEALVLDSLNAIKKEVFNNHEIPAVNKNKEIINCLNTKGVFKLKNAVSIVASNLGISKNTVYLHLRNI